MKNAERPGSPCRPKRTRSCCRASGFMAFRADDAKSPRPAHLIEIFLQVSYSEARILANSSSDPECGFAASPESGFPPHDMVRDGQIVAIVTEPLPRPRR